MTKVTLNPNKPSPAAAMPGPVDGMIDLPYGDGHVATIKRHELLAEFRFVEAMGPTITQNAAWMQLVMPLIFLVKIDGEPVPPPRTKVAAEALIQQLGHDGYKALSAGIKTHFVAALNEDSVKNS